jgi:hypothetical protein
MAKAAGTLTDTPLPFDPVPIKRKAAAEDVHAADALAWRGLG